MHLLYIETHLVALQEAVGVVVPRLKQLHLLPEFLEIVHYLRVRALVVKGGVKSHHNWTAASNTRFNVCLDLYH